MFVRRWSAVLPALGFAALALAQDPPAPPPAVLVPAGQGQAPPTPEELVKRRDAKLAAAWVKQAPWQTNFDAARAEAQKSGKLIFAYFTRSYAA